MDDGDVIVDAGDPERDGDPSDTISRLKQELADCRAEKQEYMDGWQRAKADYVNALKRFEQDGRAAEKRGMARAIEQLLPVVDALERAKSHGDIPEGFQAIARKLNASFSSLGLEQVGVVGEAFNPAVHEALGQDRVESAQMDHTVSVVLEVGWRLGAELIRPAKVRVGQFTS